MCSVAFSSCKRTSLFGYRQHFIIITWSCSIVPKKQHSGLQFKEVNSKIDPLGKKKKKKSQNTGFVIETTFLCFLPFFQSQM